MQDPFFVPAVRIVFRRFATIAVGFSAQQPDQCVRVELPAGEA